VASFWRQAEDVERLHVHLGLERVRLLGHSAGTRLAISYAAQFPDRLAGMVLVTPPAGYLVDVPSDAGELIDKRRGEPAIDAALAAWAAGPDTDDDAAFNAWQQRVAPLGYAAWGATEQAHAAIGRFSFAANRAYFSVDPPQDLGARLGEVTAPVVVVGGAEDCLTGVAAVIALAKLFPAGEAVMIERCGHSRSTNSAPWNSSEPVYLVTGGSYAGRPWSAPASGGTVPNLVGPSGRRLKAVRYERGDP
jgi:pimeloyl-ACP methyl ester carboxylesterase